MTTSPSTAAEADPKKPHRLTSATARRAVLARWDSVREEREIWIHPFEDLALDRALRYLEDLRAICEAGGKIIDDRINSDKRIKCAGPKCGKSLEGLKPNGMPKWVSKEDYKDSKTGGWRSRFFCSELCKNSWVRFQQGGGGSDGR